MNRSAKKTKDVSGTISPKISNKGVASRFDAETSYWQSNNLVDIIAWERKRRLDFTQDWIAKIAAEKQGQQLRILEIGCGAGHNLAKLSQLHPTWEFTGVDISPQMIRSCKEKFAHQKNMHFAVLNIDKFALDKKYDVVLLLGVVGYLANIDSAMKHITQMLDKDGSLLFTHGRIGLSRAIRLSVASIIDMPLFTAGYNAFKKALNKNAIAYNPVANAFIAYTPGKIDDLVSAHGCSVVASKNLCYSPGLLGRVSIYISRFLEVVFAHTDPFYISMTRVVYATKKK